MIVNTLDMEVFGKVTEFLHYCFSLGLEAELRLGLPGEFGDFCLVIDVSGASKKQRKEIEKKFKEMFGEDGYFGYVRLKINK